MRSISILALTSLLCGCEGTTENTDTNVPDFQPLSGLWGYDNLSYDDDECNFEPSFPVATLEAIQLTMAITDQGYSMASALTDDPVECVMTGMDYICEISSTTEQTEWPEGSSNTGDPDATTTAAMTASGTFSDAETASFTAVVDVSCEGADCDAYAADQGAISPCSSGMSADLVRIGD